MQCLSLFIYFSVVGFQWFRNSHTRNNISKATTRNAAADNKSGTWRHSSTAVTTVAPPNQKMLPIKNLEDTRHTSYLLLQLRVLISQPVQKLLGHLSMLKPSFHQKCWLFNRGGNSRYHRSDWCRNKLREEIDRWRTLLWKSYFQELFPIVSWGWITRSAVEPSLPL